LKLLPLDEIKAEVELARLDAKAALLPGSYQSVPWVEAALSEPASSVEDLSQRTADDLLINGRVNNGAASLFAQLAAFGNNRNEGKTLALLKDNWLYCRRSRSRRPVTCGL
jgi:hypothetical protein